MTDTQTLSPISDELNLEDAGPEISSRDLGFDAVSAINGRPGLVSGAEDVFSDRLYVDRKERLTLNLKGEDVTAPRLLLDFTEQEGDVRLIFFNDGERVSGDTDDYENGQLELTELTELAFDEVRDAGSDKKMAGYRY